MRQLILTLSILFVSLSAAAHSGGNHGDGEKKAPVGSEFATMSAQHVITNGIKRKMLPPSWEGSTPASINKTTYQEKDAWLIKYTNKTIENPAEQTLYVYLTLSGHYIAANFTGK